MREAQAAGLWLGRNDMAQTQPFDPRESRRYLAGQLAEAHAAVAWIVAARER